MGHIDLFHSRRSNYAACEYWIRDERTATGTPQEWITYNRPAGTFRAKPVSVKSNQMNVVGGVWALDSDRITIETADDVPEMSRGCLVSFNGELWIVESVQRAYFWKECEFRKAQSCKYVIAMARG